MLVNSIVSESGATLYNITPSILNLSEMKDNLSKTLNTTFKLARLTPPSVIYIDEVETIFAKKVIQVCCRSLFWLAS